MKSIFPSMLALLLARATPSSAQYYTNQSAPFYLTTAPCANTSTASEFLYSCHSGAAIEQLCLVGDRNGTIDARYGQYYLNFSSDFLVNGFEVGNLVWNMPYTINETTFNESESLNFYFNPTSNVADLLFEPSFDGAVNLGFDADNKMFIYNYVDDSVSPPNASGGYKAYYQWYSCVTYFLGYTYTALAWVTYGKPVNPSCHAVNVTRIFV